MSALASRLVLAFALAGCTIVNAPDPDKLRFDGGLDGGEDGGPDADADFDGGRDAGDGGDGGDGGSPEICTNDLDDDGDGLVDCEDFDCASDREEGGCCDNDEPVSTLDVVSWPSDLDADWDASRRVDGAPLFPRVEGGRLRFEFSDDPHAVVYEQCVPLGLGATLRADFRPGGDTTTCDGEGRCRHFAALVLSPVAEQRLPRRLAAELAITMHASGRLDISQDATLLATTNLDPLPTTFYVVDVELLVDVDDAGRGVLRVNVRVSRSGVQVFPAGGGTWSAPLISLRNLLFDRAACADSAGLRFAIEGAGNGVEVATTSAAKLACTNPSEFLRRELDPLTSGDVPGVVTASLDFDDPARTPRWADEALMSASLLGVGDTDPTWHVAAEATNDQPELVTTARVGWSIGYAFESTWNVDTWSDASQGPILGARPASCLDGTCSDPRPAAREPHLFVASDEVNVVYAAERGITERFEVRFAREVTTSALTSTLLLEPTTGEPECDSLRDPAIVPRVGVEDAYWLFFTCERAGRSSIRLRGLEVGLGGLEPTDEPSVEILASEDLGDFARDGVRSPEPVLDGDVYRVWFLGLDDVAGPSVGVALGSPKSVGAPPELVPYPANPILRSEDPPFADCLGCTLEGIAVARHPDRVDRLRFLVTRRVPLVGGGRRFELTALDQTWRASRDD
jgi:hypothetical protein